MKVPSEVGFINEVIMSDERWYFTKEQLENSPSRKSGIDADKELGQRQQAANFIRDMGQRLQVTQLCINTAIVYMHRFYVFHSFSHFHRNAIATAALFLAAKVEEQPRKLEHIIKVAQLCLQKGQSNTDRKSEVYQEQAQELVVNENILLQTLGFDVAIEHPHSFIIKFCHIANLSKELSQTSYFMASNSLYLTTMCLQYKPTVVACFCIHLVCTWADRLIPLSKDNLSWYSYIDPSVTKELMEQLTNEFLVIFDKCPSRLKKKIQNSQDSLSSQNSLSNYPFDGGALKQNANGQPSNASTSQQKLPNDNQNVPGPSRVISNFEPKKSCSYSSNHHQSFHSPAVKPSSLSATAVNGSSGTSSHENTTVSKLPNATTIPPQARSSLSSSSSSSSNSNHMSVQQQQQQQQPQQLPQMSMSSYHAHKASSSGSVHNASNTVKPKINPAFGHLTNNVPLKELSSRQEQRKPEVKHEPGLHLVNSHHQKNSFKKDNGVHQESGRFVPSSHSEIISNVVKEVAMAKQNEKRVVKTEPEEDEKPFLMDASNNLMMASTKPSRNHSIFSPSPVGPSESYKLSPVEERIVSDVPIKVEPLESKPRSRSYRPGMADSELIPVIKKVDTVAGYEDIFRKSTILVPSTSALLSPKKEITKEKTSAVPVAAVNSVQIKDELIEPKVEFIEYSKPTTAISQFLPNHSEDNVSHDKNESECTSHTHKKKKKHKEKDKRHDKEKRHKEKKRHKEDKHHHRKEHNRDSSTLRGPSPIKIVIAKDKLGDVTLPKPPKPPKPPEPPKPVTLKIIKINKDQMVVPSTSEESVPDFKSKISKDGSNSRKRERESDHEHSSKKFAYGGANSHNGYKEYKTG